MPVRPFRRLSLLRLLLRLPRRGALLPRTKHERNPRHGIHDVLDALRALDELRHVRVRAAPRPLDEGNELGLAREERAVLDAERREPPQVVLVEERVREEARAGRRVEQVVGAVVPDVRRLEDVNVEEPDDVLDGGEELGVQRGEGAGGGVLEEVLLGDVAAEALGHPARGGGDLGLGDEGDERRRVVEAEVGQAGRRDLESLGDVEPADLVVLGREHARRDLARLKDLRARRYG